MRDAVAHQRKILICDMGMDAESTTQRRYDLKSVKLVVFLVLVIAFAPALLQN